MLIFGFGRRTVKELGTTDKKLCPHCNNFRAWKYMKVTTWFTLFFIPIIPYKTMYIEECPICKSAIKVDKETAQSEGNKPTEQLTDVQRNYREQMEAMKKKDDEV